MLYEVITDQGGHVEFAAERGHVAGHAAVLGHHRGGEPEQREVFGRGVGHGQHRASRKVRTRAGCDSYNFV